MSGNEDQSDHKKLERMASVLEETLSKLGDVEKRLEQVERGETAKTDTHALYENYKLPPNDKENSKARPPLPPTPSEHATQIFPDKPPVNTLMSHQQRAALHQGHANKKHEVEHVYEIEIPKPRGFQTQGHPIYEMPDDQSQVALQRRQQNYGDPPRDYHGFAVFVLFFCCCPLGMWALIKSEEVKILHLNGRRKEAQETSRLILSLSLLGFFIGFTAILIGACAALGFI